MMQAEDLALYNVDRKEAAEYLGVSERTVDRYVRAGKLNCHKSGHHVYLSRAELSVFKSTLSERVDVEEISVVETKKEETVQAKKEVKEMSVSPTLDLSSNVMKDVENQIFKGLYEETRQELEKKHREVEALHYRLGKIEYEIQNTIPLLEYSKEKDTLEVENKVLKEETTMVKDQLQRSLSELSTERKIKTVYLVVVVVFLLIITLGVLFYLGVYNGTIRIV